MHDDICIVVESVVLYSSQQLVDDVLTMFKGMFSSGVQGACGKIILSDRKATTMYIETE